MAGQRKFHLRKDSFCHAPDSLHSRGSLAQQVGHADQVAECFPSLGLSFPIYKQQELR